MEPHPEMIRRLPKTDLHCHLDGSLRAATLRDLAREQRVELPEDEDELRRLLSPPVTGGDLDDYLKIFDLTLSVMQSEAALERVASELALDAAAEGVRYQEVRYAPILHQRDGLSLEAVIDAVVRGLERGEAEASAAGTPIQCAIILCGIRQLEPETSIRQAELAVQYKNRRVVGFDLAGAEKDHPAKHHLDAFYKIRNANLSATVHAGEAFGPDSIHQALHYCGAHRIGHGTRLREDEALLAYVNDHRIGIEVCLTSNVQTGAVTDLSSHPFGDYMRRGLRVSLNTDNRLISNTTVSQEISLACRTFDLDCFDLRRVLINGFKSAFLPHPVKVDLMHDVVATIDEVFSEFVPEYRPFRTFL